MKRTPAKTPFAPNHPPIVVSTPNVTREKMMAITTLAEAINRLAGALLSTNTAVHISDGHIQTTKTGISVT